MSKKEANFDLYLHDLLVEAGIQADTQGSNIVSINDALKTASKHQTGKAGFLEYTAVVGDFVLVMEDKADRANLCLKEADGAISMTVQATTDYADSDNSAQTATRSDRKVVSTNGMDTYSELSGEISVDVSHYEIGEMPENVKEYYLSYGSDFDTAWLNALYTDVYEYSGKYSNQVAWERFTEYMVFYDEVVDYNNELAPAPALYDVYYAYDPATEEEAALCVDDVIQIAEENGAEIQIW